MHSLRLLAASLVALSAAGAACAQSNPSADSIINSLRPGAGMMGGTRGIRPVAPSAEPAAPPAAIAPVSTPSGGQPHAPVRPALPRTFVPAPTHAVAAPSVNLTVQFGTNSADLTPAAVKTLSELGRALSSEALANFKFRIEGHTDTVGSPEANKALSERRAQAVIAFLTATFKIDGSRLEAAGMGQDGLLIQTPPNTPEPRNRRVQVINLGA